MKWLWNRIRTSPPWLKPFLTSLKRLIPTGAGTCFTLISNIISPQLLSRSLQYLQVLPREDLLYKEFSTLKPYENITRGPVFFYQIKKAFMSPSEIEPATDVLCHNISVALPTLFYLVVIAKTKSCIREPKLRNQLLFHASYLSDDRVRLKFANQEAIVTNSVYQSKSIRQQSICPTPTVNRVEFSWNYKKFRNSQNIILRCVNRTNISIKWLQEILQQHYGKCAMKIALVAWVGHRAGTQCSLVLLFQCLYCTVL